MKAAPFEYVAPRSLEEATAALAEHGDEAKVLAGGQSLVPMMAFRLATPGVLVDLNGITELEYVRDGGDVLEIGALGRHASVEHLAGLAERCPIVPEAVRMVGHVAIRNRGTVAGSLAHADPAAEWPAVLVAVDGEVEVLGPAGSRTIDGASLFVSYFTTVLAPDEIVTRVRVPLPSGDRVGCAFVELSRRHGDFAIAGVAAVLRLAEDGAVEDARIVLMGVHEVPVRATGTEAILRGTVPSDEVIAEASESVGGHLEPVSDLHASSEYRRHLARVLTRRALRTARERAEASSRPR